MKLPTLIGLTLFVVALNQANAQKYEQIRTSCELSDRIGDTLTIIGNYDRCMEYSGFQTIKKDSCSSNFQMELDLRKIPENQKLISNFKKLSKYGCGGHFNLTLTGTLRADEKTGYGHLGTNSVEFVVLEIQKIGRVKYSKLE
jgi:hypothetical protein